MIEILLNDCILLLVVSAVSFKDECDQKLYRINVTFKAKNGCIQALPMVLPNYGDKGVTSKRLNHYIESILGHKVTIGQFIAVTNKGECVVDIFSCIKFADRSGNVYDVDEVEKLSFALFSDREHLIIPTGEIPYVVVTELSECESDV